MKKVINLTNVYLIVNVGDEYYDTNGCFYRKLTISQRALLNKQFYFSMENNENISTITAYQVYIEESESVLSFNKKEVMKFEYKEKSLHTIKDDGEIKTVYKNALNPEIFISFVTAIMADKPCYEKYMEWLEFTITE